MGEARRRKSELRCDAVSPASGQPPRHSDRVAPLVAGRCKGCERRLGAVLHGQVLTEIPTDRELSPAEVDRLTELSVGWAREVLQHCEAHRPDLTSMWPYEGRPRPANAIRDPREAPRVLNWRAEHCWAASVTVDQAGDCYVSVIPAREVLRAHAAH